MRKHSPISAPPFPPPIGVELQGAESLQSFTLTGLPVRGNCNKHIMLKALYKRRKPLCLPYGHVFSDVQEAWPCFGAKLVFVSKRHKTTVFIHNPGRHLELMNFLTSISLMSITSKLKNQN